MKAAVYVDLLCSYGEKKHIASNAHYLCSCLRTWGSDPRPGDLYGKQLLHEPLGVAKLQVVAESVIKKLVLISDPGGS